MKKGSSTHDFCMRGAFCVIKQFEFIYPTVIFCDGTCGILRCLLMELGNLDNMNELYAAKKAS